MIWKDVFKKGVIMPLVSVIVPVYNTEKYLRKCLDSLINQTLRDIEIILIDDGSTDGSCKIIEEFEQKYPEKVKCYHQKNRGISISRNKGLQLSKSETVAFVDSDDSVDERFCELLYNKLVKENLDMVVCDYCEVFERNKESKRKKLDKFQNCTIYEMPELIFNINTSPWNKLYKRDFLVSNDIWFPVEVKYEDTYFVHKVLSLGARIGKVNADLVYYLVRKGSETTSVDKRVFDIFKVLAMIKRCYENIDNVVIHSYLEYFFINRITVYNLQQIYQKDYVLGKCFIKQGFEYLDFNFPNWRKNIHFKQDNNYIKLFIKSHKVATNIVVSIGKISNRRKREVIK